MMLYVPFIYFSLLTIGLKYKHQNQWDISSYLSLLYAFSALCSIPTYLLELREWSDIIPTINILPTLIYCLLLTITIAPFSHLHTEKIPGFSQPDTRIFNAFCWVMILTFCITLLNLSSDIVSAFSNGDWHALRDKAYTSETKVLSTRQYLLSIPETLLSPCSPIAIICFFYSICYLQKSKLFNTMLLLSSLTPILPAILIAGRTQIIYWFLIFLYSCCLFKNHLTPQAKYIIRTVFICFGTCAGIFTTIIAISRWGQESVLDKLLLYAGEPFLFFCDFYDHYTFVTPHFQRLFPFFHYFILGNDLDLYAYRDQIYAYSGMNIGIFYTFMGDILVDLGKIGLFIYIILYNIITNKIIANDSDTYPFYKLLILTICILVPLEGIFYYSFHTVRMSYYIIWTFILCIMFKYPPINKKIS